MPGFDIERIDYTDEAGIRKRVAVARNRPGASAAFCGHVDTVPALDWTTDPFRVEVSEGTMRGLGAVDMKGPIACLIVSAKDVARRHPIKLVLTTDEETSKDGAKAVVARSEILRHDRPAAIIIAEPTEKIPVRAHRASIEYVVETSGVAAHTATGRGRSAAWPLISFLGRVNELRMEIVEAMRDPDFEPAVCDVAIKLNATKMRST